MMSWALWPRPRPAPRVLLLAQRRTARKDMSRHQEGAFTEGDVESLFSIAEFLLQQHENLLRQNQLLHQHGDWLLRRNEALRRNVFGPENVAPHGPCSKEEEEEEHIMADLQGWKADRKLLLQKVEEVKKDIVQVDKQEQDPKSRASGGRLRAVLGHLEEVVSMFSIFGGKNKRVLTPQRLRGITKELRYEGDLLTKELKEQSKVMEKETKRNKINSMKCIEEMEMKLQLQMKSNAERDLNESKWVKYRQMIEGAARTNRLLDSCNHVMASQLYVADEALDLLAGENRVLLTAVQALKRENLELKVTAEGRNGEAQPQSRLRPGRLGGHP